MRKSFNGLGEQIHHVLDEDPFSGHLFVFRGRRGDTVKILWADADGLCLFIKRLEEGQFVWLAVRDGKIAITRSQLAMLLDKLELVSSALKVIRTVRVKKACTRCDCIVEAPAPSRPIDRGIAGPGLLARVLTAKYCEHLPLYRQCEIFARQGVDLSRALLSNWVDACCRLMAPLDEALYHYVMDCHKLHTDDTPVPVLAPGRKKTKTGRIWTYVRDDRSAGSSDPPAAWFAFSPDRQGKHPQQHLRHYHGVLQADAFAGYDRLFSPEREGGPLTEAACWAHARRKIHDVYISTHTATAEEALKRIGELYAIEEEIRGLTTEERLAARQSQSKPLLASLHEWLVEKNETLSKKSRLGEAFAYVLNQWDALCYYCEDGLAEPDNNAAERALRAVCLGKKNFIFFGSDHGGERGALLYGLIGTCRLNGIDLEAYLRHILSVLPEWPSNKVAELLPWNVVLTDK
ncbi:TPA: IS66 family transposase [Klebsiella pneumoniae]|nr:IS66 family transposase [Klebsiella pneumoniae]HBT3408670.1 IS66 family transposase [Klebsiella pneumoniae]HBT3413718.1 IS66 family transposase [Klebsiella pneumoniae]